MLRVEGRSFTYNGFTLTKYNLDGELSQWHSYSNLSQMTLILDFKENLKQKVPSQIVQSKAEKYQTNENNCHIPDLAHAFPYA